MKKNSNLGPLPSRHAGLLRGLSDPDAAFQVGFDDGRFYAAGRSRLAALLAAERAFFYLRL